MKTKVLPIFFLLFLIIPESKAQIDREIKSFIDSTELIMNNGRKLLVQSLISKDELKAGKVYYYLNDVADKRNCNFMYFNEELYTLLLLKNYRGFFDLVSNMGKNGKIGDCYNFSENYSTKLYMLMKKEADLIQSDIESQDLNEENKALLKIFFYYVKNETVDEYYSSLIKDFKTKYKQSPYMNFITGFLPAPIFKGSFAYAFGATSVSFNGDLKSVITPGILFHMSMDFNVNRIYSSMSFDIGGVNLLQSVSFKNNETNEIKTFQKDDYFSYAGGGLNFGYFLVRKKPFHFAPFVGIGGYTLESTLYKDEYTPEYQIFNSFCFSPGIHTELKITEIKMGQNYSNLYGMENYNWMYGQSKSYLSLKLDAGYNLYTNLTPGFNGNSMFFKLALVWGIGEF